jgi:DNA (cytosine-5)-methyltransferase 1
MTDEETTSVPTYVSLCSGYDGIGIGLKRAIPNLRTIAHVEIETYAIANLIAKMEEGQLDACPVFTDLKQFPYRELRDRVTILSAGFPCQPFSSAGKRQATEDPRHLYPWIADGITAMRPRYVLLENVEGIISAKTADGESVLKYVLGDLESRGYSCTWGIFSASEVGAPHQRKRVFILGNSASKRPHRGSENCEGEQSEVLGERLESDELGNTKHDGSSTIRNIGEFQGESDGTQKAFEQSEGASGQEDLRHLQETQWPARPGEEQYEWEEPRVVGDTASGGSQLDKLQKQNGQQSEVFRQGYDEARTVTEAQSFMGGTTNGTSYRVDRLRLLGNGVVASTCELAFKTLIQQLR